MKKFVESLRRWQAASGETQMLLRRQEKLIERRAELMSAARKEFRLVVHLANEFAEAAVQGQEPATRSDSPRSR